MGARCLCDPEGPSPLPSSPWGQEDARGPTACPHMGRRPGAPPRAHGAHGSRYRVALVTWGLEPQTDQEAVGPAGCERSRK